MAVIDYEKKEVNAKIVYYGPAMSGKTSNIHHIHSKLMAEHRGELMTLATKSHRTLFFDFLPVELGEVKGLNTRFYLYTVPGQIFYNNIRKQVLRDADGIVFVADSTAKFRNDNVQSYQNLEENLAEQGRSLKDIPHVIQYNKRDMPSAMSLEDLHRDLNKYNAPFFEGVAISGQGVLKALTTISKMVLKRLREGGNIQTKKDDGGPKEAYGLSDEFIAMSPEEAEQLKKKEGVPTRPPEKPDAPAQPGAGPPEAASPSAASAPPAGNASSPAPPGPAAPPREPAKAAPPPPPPAPPKPAPAPAQPRVAPAAEKLVVARWGNPQLTPGGVLKLPVVFKDPVTGKEYTTAISIQVSPLTPSG